MILRPPRSTLIPYTPLFRSSSSSSSFSSSSSTLSQNISAREVSNFFFDYDTRMEWEGTIESAHVIETLADDTIIFHHMHKRVWPSTQRETVFCSHICTLPNAPRAENQVGHTWMVCNFSVDHDKVPVSVPSSPASSSAFLFLPSPSLSPPSLSLSRSLSLSLCTLAE